MGERLRLTSLVPTEDELHETVARFMERMVLEPAFFACYPAGHIRLSKADAAKLTRAGVRRGLPDFLGWHAGTPYGVELKRPGTGRLSKSRVTRSARGAPIYRVGQEETFPMLERAGMIIAVCTRLEEVIAALRGWGIPMRSMT